MPPYASGYVKSKSSKSATKRKFAHMSAKAKLIKSIVGSEPKGPELKAVDVNSGGAAPVIRLVSTTATIDCINLLAVGASTFQRIGRGVHMKSCYLRGALFPSGNAGTYAGEYLRIAVVYDRQTNGAFPNYADIFLTVDSGGNGSNGPFDMPNLNNSERFVILADEHFSLPSTFVSGSGGQTQQAAAVADQAQCTNIDRYIKIKDFPINFKADTATIGSISSGALYVITVGSQAAATAGATFNYATRVRYTDA